MNVSKKTGLAVRLFFVACLVFSCESQDSPETAPATEGGLYTFQEPHMGTLFTMRVWVPEAKSMPEVTTVTRRAFDRVAELNRIFSDYLLDSELTRLSRAPAHRAVPVSEELFDILSRAHQLSRITDGGFDVTIGPMIRLWRRARKNQALPTPEQIEAARSRVGYEKLLLDGENRTVTKTVDGMVLDLGGIAKGYAADAALRILREGGFPRALVAASGDIALGDPPPGKPGWSVGIDTLEMAEPGENNFLLANAAVSTSGDTQKFVIIGGVRYSHILDHGTGLGLTTRIAATVIAPDATTSDSYATAVSVLGEEEGLRLIRSRQGLECRIVVLRDEAPVILYSDGYPGKKP